MEIFKDIVSLKKKVKRLFQRKYEIPIGGTQHNIWADAE